MFTHPVVDGLGWLGAGVLLVAYWLVSTKRLGPTSRPYQALNALGSVFLLVNTFVNRAYPSSFVNLVWLGIAMYAMARVGTAPSVSRE